MGLPVGLVLAGGRGRRMGRPKGELRVGGRTLAERAAATLAGVCRGVLISVAPGSDNPAPGFPAVEDSPPAGRGPLAGLDAAFQAQGEADVLVLACDYPGVSRELLLAVLACAAEHPDSDVVIPRDGAGRDHPLVGMWRRGAAAGVARALVAGAYAVQGVVAQLAVSRLGPDQLSAFDLSLALANVNGPDDLARFDP